MEEAVEGLRALRVEDSAGEGEDVSILPHISKPILESVTSHVGFRFWDRPNSMKFVAILLSYYFRQCPITSVAGW